MKVYNFNGQLVKWKLEGYTIGHKPNQLCSSYHLKLRPLLKELFPIDCILEEIPIPESNLRLDFFISTRKLAIEIDGQQHDKHITFFHHSKADFAHAKSNDTLKQNWCELNNIKLIRLKWNEEENWRDTLCNQ